MQIPSINMLKIGAKVNYMDREGQIIYHDSKEIVIKFNDGSYEKIHMDKLGWLIQDKIITLTNPDIAYEHREYKDIDPSILIVYLRAIKDESYPCSHKTITKIIDRYSILYGKPYCVSTLYKKYRIWANSGYDNSVISRSFASKRQSKFSDEVIDLVDHVIYEEYLTRDKNSIAEVYQKYIEAHLDKFQNEYYVSESSFYQIINNLSAYEVCCAREGKKIADAKFRKITSFYVPNFPLEVVEIDALHINYSVLNEQRNIVLGTILIYIAIDRYSRALVGYYIDIKGPGSGERTEHVVELLKSMMHPKSIMPHCNNQWFAYGKPNTIIHDAGPAFNNAKVKDVALGFGCTVATTPAGDPQKKPFVEKMNRTIRESFASKFPGYLDKNGGDSVVPKNWRELNAYLTLSEFKKYFEEWFCDLYHQHEHRGLDGATPQQVWHDYYSRPGISQPVVPEYDPRCYGEKYIGTIQAGKGVQYNYSFYNSDELQSLYFSLKTENNKNPKVEFYIDYEFNPSFIWVKNEKSGILFEVQTTGLRQIPQKKVSNGRLSFSANKRAMEEIQHKAHEKQKQNKANKRVTKRTPSPSVKEYSHDELQMMLNKKLPDPKNSATKNVEIAIINPDDIDELESY